MEPLDALDFGRSTLDVRLFELGGTPVSLWTIGLLVVMTLATFWLARLLERGTSATLRARKIGDEGGIRAIGRLTYYVVLIVGCGVGLQTAGFNLSALFAASAVFAVGLGFAFQNLAQNFVSGILLLLEQSITPGDVLEVEGRVVRVIQMRMRTTVARTRDDEDLIIPNSTLVQATVKNYTLQDSIFRLRGLVGVAYRSDMRRVREVLEQTAEELGWRLQDRPPVINLMSFGDSSVNWEINVWTEDPWGAQRNLGLLNEAIWWALQDAGIEIAFPQLDVHLDAPVVRALGGLREVV